MRSANTTAGQVSDLSAPVVPSSARGRSIGSARRRFIICMLLPATLLLAGLTVLPFVVSLGLSLTNWSLIDKASGVWIGFSNYTDLVSSTDFWKAARVTAIFTVTAVAIEMILGVGIAALLHKERRQDSWLRPIYLLPMAITPVAATFTFRLMFNAQSGVFNYFLTSLGFSPSEWTAGVNAALWSLILVDVWQWTPFILLIMAGGLAALPEEPEEASAIDGANALQTFFYVILPQLKQYLALALVFRAIDAFKTFDIIFVLTGGGPGTATRTLNLLAYKQGIEFLSMGKASAIAIVMLIFALAVSQTFLRRIGLFDLRDPGA